MILLSTHNIPFEEKEEKLFILLLPYQEVRKTTGVLGIRKKADVYLPLIYIHNRSIQIVKQLQNVIFSVCNEMNLYKIWVSFSLLNKSRGIARSDLVIMITFIWAAILRNALYAQIDETILYHYCLL